MVMGPTRLLLCWLEGRPARLGTFDKALDTVPEERGACSKWRIIRSQMVVTEARQGRHRDVVQLCVAILSRTCRIRLVEDQGCSDSAIQDAQ